MLIQSLRDLFRRDSVFTYRDDEYGFPLTPDLTGKPLDTDESTRILISDIFRYDVKFFPAITIKHNGGSYKPISFNQDMTIKYRSDIVENIYGAKRKVLTPTHRVYTGSWDMNFDVMIYAESQSELEELVDIVSLALQYNLWNELRANGLFIKSLRIGGESAEPYANDYVYNVTISLNTLSEWRVEIPIENIVEKITFSIEPSRTPIPGSGNAANLLSTKYESILELTEITQ